MLQLELMEAGNENALPNNANLEFKMVFEDALSRRYTLNIMALVREKKRVYNINYMQGEELARAGQHNAYIYQKIVREKLQEEENLEINNPDHLKLQQ